MAYNEMVKLEWDETKSRRNHFKHGLSFEDAQQLFLSGVDYLDIFDEHHSDHEERFIAIGPIDRGVVLVVWTELVDVTYLIISARFATKREQALYLSYSEQIK